MSFQKPNNAAMPTQDARHTRRHAETRHLATHTFDARRPRYPTVRKGGLESQRLLRARGSVSWVPYPAAPSGHPSSSSPCEIRGPAEVYTSLVPAKSSSGSERVSPSLGEYWLHLYKCPTPGENDYRIETCHERLAGSRKFVQK